MCECILLSMKRLYSVNFVTFLEALKVVGLALHEFEDVIRTFEHTEMGCREKMVK